MTATLILKLLVYILGAFVSNRISNKVLIPFEPSLSKSLFLIFVTLLSWIWIGIILILILFQSIKNSR
jgi:hypothetical protein